ncbi:MAG: ComEA family DNA-binding protein [Chloroflexota bacterium]|nr:ComEA family DNA-binding protein [Chloroflexota bacterium]
MAFLHGERIRWLLTACVVVLAIVFVVQLRPQSKVPTDATLLVKASALPAPDVQPAAVSPTAAPEVAVDVIGAVQQPGVYYLPSKARVADVIAAAGGLAPTAARDQINLAAPIIDGTQIRVPHVGEAAEATVAAPSAEGNGLIDINTADAATLEALPGIGPATAQAIIDERIRNGSFKQIEDVQNVKGIGPSLFAQLKAHITVGQ